MDSSKGVLTTRVEAKRHETLAAAAGYVMLLQIGRTIRASSELIVARYCAVLVVFLGNVGNYGSGTGSLPVSG
jgi:hypothetical protein